MGGGRREHLQCTCIIRFTKSIQCIYSFQRNANYVPELSRPVLGVYNKPLISPSLYLSGGDEGYENRLICLRGSTPSLISFQWGWKKILCTVLHLRL